MSDHPAIDRLFVGGFKQLVGISKNDSAHPQSGWFYMAYHAQRVAERDLWPDVNQITFEQFMDEIRIKSDMPPPDRTTLYSEGYVIPANQLNLDLVMLSLALQQADKPTRRLWLTMHALAHDLTHFQDPNGTNTFGHNNPNQRLRNAYFAYLLHGGLRDWYHAALLRLFPESVHVRHGTIYSNSDEEDPNYEAVIPIEQRGFKNAADSKLVTAIAFVRFLRACLNNNVRYICPLGQYAVRVSTTRPWVKELPNYPELLEVNR